jgi:hypothetical protein
VPADPPIGMGLESREYKNMETDMRRKKTIRDVVMLLAVSMMLAVGCDSTPPLNTSR